MMNKQIYKLICFLLLLFISVAAIAEKTLKELESQLEQEITDKEKYESELKTHQESLDTIDSIKEYFTTDNRSIELRAKIKYTKSKITATRAAIVNAKKTITDLKQENIKLAKEIKNLQSRLNQQLADKKKYEANLKSHQKSASWSDKALNFFVDDRRTKFLKTKIKETESSIAATRAALTANVEKIKNNQREIALRTVKENPEILANETKARYDAAIEAVAGYETQLQQIEAGEKAFKLRIAELDTAITERKKQGLTNVAAQFEKDKERVEQVHKEWLANANKELEGYKALNRSQFEINRADGIGPTNSGMVNSEIRKRARARGQSTVTEDARKALVDEAAVTSTEASAAAVAKGAPSSTQHLSIFNDLNLETVKDFLQDMEESNEGVFTTGKGWYEFSLRIGSYTKGVAKGTGDALVDLLVIAREVGDTGMEGLQAALRTLGIDANSFGTENLDTLAKLAKKYNALMDLDNPEGEKIAKEFVALADALVRKAERSTEQLSAKGDVHKGLYYLGYGTSAVVGSERIALEGGALVVKGAVKGAGALSNLGKADTGPINLSDDVVLGPVDPSLKPGQSGVHVAAPKKDASSMTGATTVDEAADANVGDLTRAQPGQSGGTMPPPGARATPDPDTKTKTDDVTEAPPVTGSATLPPSRAPPAVDTRTVTGFKNLTLGPNPKGDGKIPYGEVTLSDGTIVKLDPSTFIGAGSTSAAYRMPDGKILKFTRNIEGVDIGLDRHGYELLVDAGLDTSKLQFPAWHTTSKLPSNPHLDNFSGGVVALIDEAPSLDFKVASKNRRFFTAPELKAYRTGIDELNSKGIVFLDNKSDNFYFVDLPDGSKVLGIPDTGSLLKLKDPKTGAVLPDKAREFQRMVDTGDYGLDFQVGDHVGRSEFGKWALVARRYKLKEVMEERFGPFIDLSGTKIDDFTEFPFLPSGLIWSGGFPGVKALSNTPIGQLDNAFANLQLNKFGKSDINALTKDEFIQYLQAYGFNDNAINRLADIAPNERKNILAQMTEAATAPHAGPTPVTKPGTATTSSHAGDATVPPPTPSSGTSASSIPDAAKLDPDISKMSDSEFVDFLKNQAGWSDSMIDEIMDLPIEKRKAAFASFRGGKDLRGGRALGPNRLGLDGESGENGEAGTGSLISIGDGSLATQTVPPIYFQIPVIDPKGGISTTCPSWCQSHVDRYNALLLGDVKPKPKDVSQALNTIKNVTLPKCERENCGDESSQSSALDISKGTSSTATSYSATAGDLGKLPGGFGPLPGNIATKCTPCQVYVDNYNKTLEKIKDLRSKVKDLWNQQAHAFPFGGVLDPEIEELQSQIADATNFLNAIKLSLFACEKQCARVVILNVFNLFGNFPYDRRNPLVDAPGNTGSIGNTGTDSSGGSSGATVLVVNNIPIFRLSLAGPDACPDSHYHGDANNCNGVFTTDPAPGVCGQGTVSMVINIPVESCPDL